MTLRLEKDQLIVFDGDSMTNRRSEGNPDTWPFLRLMNWDKPWPDLMAEMLFCWRAELNLSFFNAASAGATCRELSRRLEANVLSRKPDWVIVSVAGNDITRGISLEEYRETMADYARRLRAAGAQVVFYGVSEHGPDYPKAATLPDRRARYAALASIAESDEGVHFVDIGPGLASKARALREQCELHTIYGDCGHFNAVGQMIVAGEILSAFGVVHAP